MVAPPGAFGIFCCLIAVFDAGQAVDAREHLQCPSLMSLVSNAAARGLPEHPGQACSLADGKKWAVAVRRLLPADWLSLLNGVRPRVLLQYLPLTVPGALVYTVANDATGTPGVPQSSVISRELEINRITDSNAVRALSKAAHEAELHNDFFVALEISLSESSPLLLDKLRKDHELTYGAGLHDGVEAFKAICARYEATHIDHPERGSSS